VVAFRPAAVRQELRGEPGVDPNSGRGRRDLPAGGRGGSGLERRPRGDSCVVPEYTQPLEQLWHPDLQTARAYVHTRRGDIAFAVCTDSMFQGYRAGRQEWSASVLKAMLLVATSTGRPCAIATWTATTARSCSR
jgi:hypothetical protein